MENRAPTYKNLIITPAEAKLKQSIEKDLKKQLSKRNSAPIKGHQHCPFDFVWCPCQIKQVKEIDKKREAGFESDEF